MTPPVVDEKPGFYFIHVHGDTTVMKRIHEDSDFPALMDAFQEFARACGFLEVTIEDDFLRKYEEIVRPRGKK